MFLLEGDIIVSASDITQAGSCEFAFLRRFDQMLGRDVTVPRLEDAMLDRASKLGDEHEERQLVRYRDEFGPEGVQEIARPEPFTRAGIEQRAAETTAALHSDAAVIFQATFFDPVLRPATSAAEPTIGFIGFADFLKRTVDDTGQPAWQVQDTKLARTARVPALLQIAAYGEQIERVGSRTTSHAALLLGDGSQSEHRLSELAPVYRSRRARLMEIVLRTWARGEAITEWGDPDVFSCGKCEVCQPEIERTRDPLLVAGMRQGQRQRLIDGGVETIDALARLTAGAEVPGLGSAVLERLRAQAAAQVASESGETPSVTVREAAALSAIPEPSEGDLFFDFEGDPMYQERLPDGTPRWGLDYLFGMIDPDEHFTALWAHTHDEERVALESFLDMVAARRAAHPDMHVYHYAPYERSHLLSIAARHGVREADVDVLLRDGVLVDLYPIVREALTVGSRSYSIKKLEPLYMGDELRDADGVTDGAQSVTEYAEARRMSRSSEHRERDEAQRMLDGIADYNRYDCVSTLRLRDWLRGIATEYGVAAAPVSDPSVERDAPESEVSKLGQRLLALAAAEQEPREARALRLAASAIDYHQREQKSFWWAHFARLVDPIEDWADTRDVFVVEPGKHRVLETWHTPPRARKQRRVIMLGGVLAPGSSLKEGQSVFAVYAAPAPFARPGAPLTERGARQVTVLERDGDRVVVQETLPDDAAEWHELPIALTPGPPPHAGAQKTAIETWGSAIAAATEQGESVSDPVFDMLRLAPPRFLDRPGPVATDDPLALRTAGGDPEAATIGAVVASLRSLDHSYLAVQGPPGTGKTYLASRVIKQLVEQDGWRIGIVAQSHKVVENVLDGIISAGLDSDLVAKVPQGGRVHDEAEAPEWRVLRSNGHAAFLSEARDAGRGAVIGGTAWDMSHEGRIEPGSLDLLVIDEAGQFSLAPTIAASQAAANLLLLGDPSQLPQVSQGSHPEPVDSSALGWLIGDHDTLPESLGYFLEVTRRMRPELASVDSALSYEGKLHAHESTLDRELEGVGPAGLTWHPVPHRGNATFSPEEARAVAVLAATMVTGTLRYAGAEPRAITQADIIVVAAYNAQVECVTQELERAGLGAIRVGTVDKFQGQEAALAIVTLAASSPYDVPRGLDFLLMRNRLNVAISRAQWAAHLVSSPSLSGVGLPATVAEVTALSGYLSLIERAHLAPEAGVTG